MTNDKWKSHEKNQIISTSSCSSPPFNGFIHHNSTITLPDPSSNDDSSSEYGRYKSIFKNTRSIYNPEYVSGPYSGYICKLKPDDKLYIIIVNNYLHKHPDNVISIKPLTTWKLEFNLNTCKKRIIWCVIPASNLHSMFIFLPSM